jgi:hypothetical protein
VRSNGTVTDRTSGKRLQEAGNTMDVLRCAWLESTSIAMPQQALREMFDWPLGTSSLNSFFQHNCLQCAQRWRVTRLCRCETNLGPPPRTRKSPPDTHEMASPHFRNPIPCLLTRFTGTYTFGQRLAVQNEEIPI